MLISSNLKKLKYKQNVLLKMDNENNLHKNSIVKTDIIYKILDTQIQFKIGKVTPEKVEQYKMIFYNNLCKENE